MVSFITAIYVYSTYCSLVEQAVTGLYNLVALCYQLFQGFVLFRDFLTSSVPHRLGMGPWGEGFTCGTLVHIRYLILTSFIVHRCMLSFF